MFEFIRTKEKTPVYLNIYNFVSQPNKCCACVGLGVYHTAIEVDGIQYMFYGFDGDESGVIEIQPKSASYQFAQQFLLGYTDYGYYQLQTQVLQPLRLQFLGNRYDLLNNNCNHFALRMAEMLNLGQNHPKSRIFKITDCCNLFRCCIPNCILSGRLDWFIKDEDSFQEMEEHLHDCKSRPRSMKSISSANNNAKYEQLIEQQEENYQDFKNYQWGKQASTERQKKAQTKIKEKTEQQTVKQTTKNHELN